MDRKENKGDEAIDVDDAEIKGYLNTRKDMIYKNIIWEILNKNYLQGKCQKEKQKQPRKEKNEKGEGAKRKKRVDDDIESKKKKKQRLSLKVNFDVLDKQGDDGNECGKEEKNKNAKTVESEENYVDDEEDGYVDVNGYYGNEDDEEEGYNFDEDY